MARLATGERRYGDPIGPPATITREPGQSRKAAATAGTLCAGVWLVGLPPNETSLPSNELPPPETECLALTR